MSEVIREGYKQTKVGVIPEDWDVVRLKDILKVSQGLQIVISNRFIEPAKDRVFYITLPYIEGKKVEYIENPKQSVLCTKEDLLVVRTGSGVGKIVTGVEGAFHNNFFKIKGFDNLNLNFLYYFLTSSRTRYLMKTYASNGTIPDLPHGDFYSLNCILPPLQEQQKIAQILSTWDDAISKQETFIKAKEALKKGLMQKLLSGEIRFDGFEGEWEEVKLSDIAKITMGQSPSSSSYNEQNIGIPLIQGNADCKNRKTLPRVCTTEKTKECFIDDIIMTVRAPVGAISKSFHNACIGRGVCAIKAKKDNQFLYHFLVNYEEKWEKYSQGSTFTAVNSSDIKNLKIKFPLKEEQEKVAQVLTLADKEIDLLKNELESLKEQKRGLMQRLLMGEVRTHNIKEKE